MDYNDAKAAVRETIGQLESKGLLKLTKQGREWLVIELGAAVSEAFDAGRNEARDEADAEWRRLHDTNRTS